MANGRGPSGSGGMHLPIDRRSLLRATTVLASAGLLGSGGGPVIVVVPPTETTMYICQAP